VVRNRFYRICRPSVVPGNALCSFSYMYAESRLSHQLTLREKNHRIICVQRSARQRHCCRDCTQGEAHGYSYLARTFQPRFAVVNRWKRIAAYRTDEIVVKQRIRAIPDAVRRKPCCTRDTVLVQCDCAMTKNLVRARDECSMSDMNGMCFCTP
jgi:hypothetical protein